LTLHQALDELVACYLAENGDRRPSTTTVLELIEWSARRNFEAARVAAVEAASIAADAEGRCTGCGRFLSVERRRMRIDRCSDCDGTSKGRGHFGRPVRR
jgi:hypothetical protein